MSRITKFLGFIILLLITGISLAPTTTAQDNDEPIMFHCALDDTCPEILIGGNPFAQIGNSPAPFRGYGDPSLEYDPSTDTLWLSYSWLDVLVTPTDADPLIDFGVRTHLAQSTDHGQSFQFERAVNETTQFSHSEANLDGWLIHEVSTLVHQPDGDWQIMWLSYFDPFGETVDRFDFYYAHTTASTPEELGDTSQAWIRGFATSDIYEARYNLSAIGELGDCAVFTEPALFSDGTDTYLATGCIVVDGGQRRPEHERVVLLRQTNASYEYLGILLDAEDAAFVNADRLEQADISFSHDGAILLIITPILDNADPQHQGCIVYEIDDLSTAHVKRDADNHPIPRAIITADGNGLGPGLCTYDPASETGIMLVITSVDLVSNPPDIIFSLRATGIHP